MSFKSDFMWGASTSSAQIEGAYNEDGKGLSIWDIAPKEKIKNGVDMHTSSDFYHHKSEDIATMKELGFNSYRFSLSWPRIISEKGKVNEKGLKFYSDLIDELIANGIEPIVTLYHWDEPVWVEEEGGWKSESTIGYFEEYTRVVVDALSDRVKYWITFNEPQCFLMNGYMTGVHAPFKSNYLCLNEISNIFMRTNYVAVKTIRERAKKNPLVGLSFSSGAYIPKDEKDPMSIEKAKHDTFYKGMGIMNNRFWMDPILLGKSASAYGIFHTKKKDLSRIYTDLDFIALNNYEAFNYSNMGGDKDIDKSKLNLSNMGWVIDGRSLYWVVRFIYERYKKPIIITENGVALDDKVENGRVKDKKREEFMDEYLTGLKRASDEGIPLLGYEYWSLLDNFEWAEGYGPRFGLIHVDYETKKRIVKDSAYHYRDIIKSNGEILK